MASKAQTTKGKIDITDLVESFCVSKDIVKKVKLVTQWEKIGISIDRKQIIYMKVC